MIIDYCVHSKFFILHDKSPVEAWFHWPNNIIILKKKIKIVAFLSYLLTKKNLR